MKIDKNFIAISLVALFIVATGAIGLYMGQDRFNPIDDEQANLINKLKGGSDEEQPERKADTSILIVGKDEKTTSYTISYVDGESVYSAMTRLSQTNTNFTFTSEDVTFGIMLKGINGYEATQENKEFWGFYVNDKMAEEGIATYIIKEGEVISFKVEGYQK